MSDWWPFADLEELGSAAGRLTLAVPPLDQDARAWAIPVAAAAAMEAGKTGAARRLWLIARQRPAGPPMLMEFLGQVDACLKGLARPHPFRDRKGERRSWSIDPDRGVRTERARGRLALDAPLHRRWR